MIRFDFEPQKKSFFFEVVDISWIDVVDFILEIMKSLKGSLYKFIAKTFSVEFFFLLVSLYPLMYCKLMKKNELNNEIVFLQFTLIFHFLIKLISVPEFHIINNGLDVVHYTIWIWTRIHLFT